MVIGQNPAIENSIWIREDVINAHKDVSLVLDPVIWLPIKHISQVSQGSLIPCLSLLIVEDKQTPQRLLHLGE